MTPDPKCGSAPPYTVFTEPIEVALATGESTSGSTSHFATESAVSGLSISSLVRSARRAVRQTDNAEVVERATDLLLTIQETLEVFQRQELQLSHFPPLHAVSTDEGSILIEWAFSDFRIGFSVDPDPSDSSWYLVSTKNLGEIAASGYFAGVTLRSLVLWLISFAVVYS